MPASAERHRRGPAAPAQIKHRGPSHSSPTSLPPMRGDRRRSEPLLLHSMAAPRRFKISTVGGREDVLPKSRRGSTTADKPVNWCWAFTFLLSLAWAPPHRRLYCSTAFDRLWHLAKKKARGGELGGRVCGAPPKVRPGVTATGQRGGGRQCCTSRPPGTAVLSCEATNNLHHPTPVSCVKA